MVSSQERTVSMQEFIVEAEAAAGAAGRRERVHLLRMLAHHDVEAREFFSLVDGQHTADVAAACAEEERLRLERAQLQGELAVDSDNEDGASSVASHVSSELSMPGVYKPRLVSHAKVPR